MTISFIKLYVIFFFFYKPKNKMEKKINKLLKATFVSCRHLYLMLYIISFFASQYFLLFPFSVCQPSLCQLHDIWDVVTWIYLYLKFHITLSKTTFTYGRYPYTGPNYIHILRTVNTILLFQKFVSFYKFFKNLPVLVK